MVGIVITGASWVATAKVQSLNMLYLTYGGLGGIGTGIVYVGVVSLLMQWFPKTGVWPQGLQQRGMAWGRC